MRVGKSESESSSRRGGERRGRSSEVFDRNNNSTSETFSALAIRDVKSVRKPERPSISVSIRELRVKREH